MEITIKTELSNKDIGNLLISAFEGGSNYWYMILERIEPKVWEFEDKQSDGENFLYTCPLNPGGALMIDDSQADDPTLKKPVRLDQARIKQGLEIMAIKYPKYWADVISEDTDANTGDVFLQCCIFGELIYG